jgi:Helix-turn-helix
MRAVYLMNSEGRKDIAAFRTLHPKYLKTKMELERAVQRSRGEDLWIVLANKTIELLSSDIHFASRKTPSLIVLGDIPQPRIDIIKNFFKRSICQQEIRLPFEQLAEVMAARDRSDLLIGGEVDQEGGMVLFYRGDFSPLLVPLSAFPQSGDGTKPDFRRFTIEDSGQSVRFGEYEASTESILYEFDAGYRKRHRKNLIKTEKRLGASIRRLRLQKGLRQNDFPDIHEKEIRRIEAGDVKKPHQSTLQKIAAKLGVSVEDLGSY